MYAAIRRYNIAPGSADTIIERVNERFLPSLRRQPGFVSYYLVNPDDGTIVAVAVFEDRAGAEASTRLATEWVRRELPHLIRTAPVIITGDVVSRATSGAAT